MKRIGYILIYRTNVEKNDYAILYTEYTTESGFDTKWVPL